MEFDNIAAMDPHVDQQTIIDYVRETFDGVNVVAPSDGVGAGDTFFIYDPERNLEPKRQFPFATIVTKDYGDFDNASKLNRPGIFRLNVGVSQGTYRSLFGAHVSVESGQYDYSALDQVLPHPVYGSQAWICVLNPGPETFQAVKPLLAEAYERAVRRIANRDPAET